MEKYESRSLVYGRYKLFDKNSNLIFRLIFIYWQYETNKILNQLFIELCSNLLTLIQQSTNLL